MLFPEKTKEISQFTENPLSLRSAFSNGGTKSFIQRWGQSMTLHEVIEKPREKAIAVSVGTDARMRTESLEHLDELAFLAETAGADVIQKMYQERPRLDGGTAVGRGKVAELKEIIEQEKVTLLIFDNDLTPGQIRNLERELEIKVMDRSGIILDIFANRARTMEAKTQVELAQLQYLLPRLSRMWTHLSKQLGGIGTKGPGETQIETDRRLIRTRITHLQEKLAKIAVQKSEQRKGRETLPRFALVGYTNAGKSTLMNHLSGANVEVENKLFATLDTTVRSIALSDGKPAILSDTVGFIRKLPTHLVASFRSTLAETLESDVLLHVVDVSHPAFREHIEVVRETLESLNAHQKPTLMVFNKIDCLESLEEARFMVDSYPNSVAISAQRGINISTLREKMTELAREYDEELSLLVPYTAMKILPELYALGDVLERKDTDDGMRFRLKIQPKFKDVVLRKAGKFLVEEEEAATF